MALTAQPGGLLPSSVPDYALVLLAAAAVAAWVGTHFLLRGGKRADSQSPGSPAPRPDAPPGGSSLLMWPVFAVRVLIGCGAIWLVLNLLARVLVLATNWPLWVPALIGGFAVEAILFLYLLERRAVSRRAGLILVGLRLVLTLLVVLVLVQPVFSREWTRTVERYVAVLMDESTSMRLVDTQMTPSEKMRLAGRLSSEPFARFPYRLDQLRREMTGLAQQLAAQGDGLELLRRVDSDTLSKQIEIRRDELKTLFANAGKGCAGHLQVIGEIVGGKIKLEPVTTAGLQALAARLANNVQAPVSAALQITESAGKDGDVARQYSELIGHIRTAERALKELAAQNLPALEPQLEEAYFRSLTPEQRKVIDDTVSRTRQAITRNALLGRVGEEPSLLTRLEDKYTVKLYRFAAQPVEVETERWKQEAEPAAPKAEALSKEPASALATDYAAALKKVLADIPPGRLAGVLLASDGRQNGKESCEATAVRLAAQKAPICSILIGSTTPPVDASVVSVEAPETVYVGDKLAIRADLKFDGLKGREAVVTLECNGQKMDEKTVPVTGPNYRTSVNFEDNPKQKGISSYRIKVEPFAEELFKSNNERTTPVVITDDRAKLLVIEGRARWEFRYLRNLFAGRDKTVQIQHVLLHPDLIEGAPPLPAVHASAARPITEIEATALPKDEEEWLKFDVIILGDVSPHDLGEAGLKAIEKFVAERGGTLVAVAGPDYLPDAYLGTPLRDLLPMNFSPPDPKSAPPPVFHIALSEAGQNHAVMRQGDSPENNLRIWESIPEIYWRHPVADVKPGATVLAYAMPMKRPEIFEAKAVAELPTAAQVEKLMEDRREYERKNALIAVQKYSAGQVMMLAFDQSWRLRYRVGDTYHHKFWGQVMRWATADRLAVGTSQVRLGTGQVLYYPGDAVSVRAKITNKDLSPVKTAEAVAKVYEGKRVVLQKKMDFVPGSPGLYTADLGVLEAGKTYRIQLDCPEAARILAEQGVSAALETQVIVAETPTEELKELAADRAALDKLAGLTGGIVADLADPAAVLGKLGPGKEEIPEQWQFVLWNSWPLFILILAVATGEWALRKRMGLT